jgi:hypothetical protein
LLGADLVGSVWAGVMRFADRRTVVRRMSFFMMGGCGTMEGL